MYDSDTIISYFQDEILNGNIKLPLRDLTENDAMNSFLNLYSYDVGDFEYSKTYSKYEYKLPISDKFIPCGVEGNVASDYFQQENRFYCGSSVAPSPYRTWHSREFLYGALSSLWSMKHDYVSMSTLRTCISLRKYIASQFKQTVAKFIYTKYKSENVLDFSSGWGDRLCGFYATKNTKKYIGIDPNKKVYDSYFKQIEFYNKFVNGKFVELYNSPAEDVILDSEIVDTVFTSPPYFNREKYSDDENQSYKKYNKIDKWLEGFLYPTLNMSCNALKYGGYMIINISDVYTNGEVRKICDPMNEYLSNIGMEFEEAYGLPMSKRPNNTYVKDIDEGTFVEPIWVWRKL